jgi:hypothetical protein
MPRKEIISDMTLQNVSQKENESKEKNILCPLNEVPGNLMADRIKPSKSTKCNEIFIIFFSDVCKI